MTLPFTTTSSFIITIFISLFLVHSVVNGLGLASTVALTYERATLCGIVAGQPTQRIQCYQNNRTISVLPNVSFQAISGGRRFFCGLRSGGFILHCWDTSFSNSSFQPKRIYHSRTVGLTDLTVGDVQVCAREINTGIVRCWRGRRARGSLFPSPGEALMFRTITSGSGFTCGILSEDHRVVCWGQSLFGAEIQNGFANLAMISLVAGESHACGLTKNGTLVCRGNNVSGQLNVPSNSAFEYSSLALGANFTCALKETNRLVVCWGERNILELHREVIGNLSFELIVAGLDFVCGLMTSNLSIICWGPGWSNSENDLPLGMILPGPCVQSSCSTCGTYPDSQILCRSSKNICKSCQIELPIAVPWQTPIPSPQPKAMNKLCLVFLIVGSVGAFAGLCSIVFWLWERGILFSCSFFTLQHDRDSAVRTDNASTARPPSKGQVSRSLSSSKHAEKTETFSLSELAASTNNFSPQNKIGSGSFGVVYKGKLLDGREVAIKRGEASTKMSKFHEKETAFDSELSSLSRLNHKNLVALLGFCHENDERLLIEEEEDEGDGIGPMSVVEYALPKLRAGELQSVLDKRVGPPGGKEVEAVELMAYTAMDCLKLEGKERPGMSDIVANLEKAFSLCEEEDISPQGEAVSFSATTFSSPTD
ncbi:hypothetical protein FEM48_Zijuj02G0052900 [Ziziphus jujuba var. spinosa]|uniref:Protein kinase domain-containing protein n=1 Tax=Ziziphus jujuba var. spinosa TaxID=714518 RepID=A0A978VTV0_ZIZJJ|nr:hypothetical protein FEM48_Zijuj02G0052900 [Ziziphus jujuba var. spinosa]